MPTVTILNHNLEISSQPTFSLLNNFLINDAPIHGSCGGHANCGCCRIRILEGPEGMTKANEREMQKLGEKLLAAGWRLSCQAHSLRDIVIHMPTGNELDRDCSKL
ncbi:MAG: (2Fe-2S)-binding protein [Proteobacteria bacterium]|nr:(2Fe-2S)-binding protein [Pseudomonadota bacterium]MBU1456433.1 (2Fe-2S)-binding protein [Pseudomonadota bacterium]